MIISKCATVQKNPKNLNSLEKLVWLGPVQPVLSVANAVHSGSSSWRIIMFSYLFVHYSINDIFDPVPSGAVCPVRCGLILFGLVWSGLVRAVRSDLDQSVWSRAVRSEPVDQAKVENFCRLFGFGVFFGTVAHFDIIKSANIVCFGSQFKYDQANLAPQASGRKMQDLRRTRHLSKT